MNDIIPFLLRAKRATYAGNGARAASSRPASQDFNYCEGELRYIDSYLGSAKFAGEEAVWNGASSVWAMNYVGRTLADGFSVDFLKDALSQATAELPFRGPLRYESGDFVYLCSVKGDFAWFYGFEEIFFRGERVYECAFHGGEID